MRPKIRERSGKAPSERRYTFGLGWVLWEQC